MSIGSSEEMIKARYQTAFWKDFIKHISSLGSEAYKFEKLQTFQDIFVRLTSQIILHFEVRPSDVFLEFNFQDSNDDQFDDYFRNKRDLGKIIRETSKLVGCKEMATLFMSNLELKI